jgi:Ni/Fe-hydrogenase 1 B-type cytochrome subunit
MTHSYPSTPPASRVREGAFGEAILPVGVQPGPVYVYNAATRIWHWVTMLSIIALCVTGYFIGAPLPSIGGQAYDHFLFGDVRMVHFIAGQVLGVAFLLRLYSFFFGGPHARQIFYIPFWSLHWWKEVFGEIRWYLFVGKPKEYVGHNPLAHLAMFLMFLLPTIVLLLTGFALYAEGAGVQTIWFKLFGWVFTVIGNSFSVHTWHHVAMWIVIIFSIVHMYMAIREDLTHRQTTVSSMISGWRFFR